MADVPKADEVWRRHSAQWQMYSAIGLSRGVLKETAPHWQFASMVSEVVCVMNWEFLLSLLHPSLRAELLVT